MRHLVAAPRRNEQWPRFDSNLRIATAEIVQSGWRRSFYAPWGACRSSSSQHRPKACSARLRPRKGKPSVRRSRKKRFPPRSAARLCSEPLVLDSNYFRARVAPPNIGSLPEAKRTAAASRLPPELMIQLFPNVSLDFRRSGVTAYGGSSNVFYWYGFSLPPRNCDLRLFARDSTVSEAIINCVDVERSYYVTKIDGSFYRAAETNMPKVPSEDDTPDDQSVHQRQGSLRSPQTAPVKVIVDVLDIYLAQGECFSDTRRYGVRRNLSQTQFDLLVRSESVENEFAEANTILGVSGANVFLRSVGSMDIRICDGTEYTFEEVLALVSSGAEPFQDVHGERNRVKGDLVSVWYSPTVLQCGFANFNANPRASTSNKALLCSQCW